MIHANLGPSVFPPRPTRPVGTGSAPAAPAASVAPPTAAV
jgi:hypothetical protein